MRVAGCFVFAAAGSPIVADFLSARLPVLGEVARGFSVAEHFGSFVRGVIALPDLVFFAAFTGSFTIDRSGPFGYTVRVLPDGDGLTTSAELGLVVSA